MQQPTRSAILYARVSGREQGKSGLGLSHQIDEMKKFCTANNIEILDIRQEIISGKYYLERRPVLKKAFEDAARANTRSKECFILTSRLDRLSRELYFICDLMQQSAKFITVETGLDCGPLNLQIRATIAEDERRRAIDRSKGACQVKREKGVPMGMNLFKVYLQKERSLALCKQSIMHEADSFADFMKPTIQMLRREGNSVNKIADYLNTHNFKTQRGGKWYAKTVSNIMSRWPV